MVAEAGFDGMCLDPAVAEIPEMRELSGLYRKFNLGCMVNAFPATEDDMVPLLDFANEMDACMVNVISGVMPLRPEDSVPVVERWMCEAKERDMPLLFETHRDGMLNDMYYTLLLMDLVPEMRLCADLSHFVVDREMRHNTRSGSKSSRDGGRRACNPGANEMQTMPSWFSCASLVRRLTQLPMPSNRSCPIVGRSHCRSGIGPGSYGTLDN
jgi:hypothetical protein